MFNNLNHLDSAVNNFKDGNKYAFTQIYKDTNRLVYKCAFDLVKNDSDANDIVQNVYLKVYNKIHTLDDTSKFKSWLLSITYNEAKNLLISQQRYNQHVDTNVDIFEDEDLCQSENEELSPDELYSINETNKNIKDLINTLPYEQREVLKLYYFEEKDVNTIATILKCPKGTVLSRLNYARKKLKKSIEEYESKNQVRLHSSILAWINIEYLDNLKKCNRFGKISAVGISTIGTVAIGFNVYGIYNNWNDNYQNDLNSNNYAYVTTIDTETTTTFTPQETEFNYTSSYSSRYVNQYENQYNQNDDIIANGRCGDNVNWYLYEDYTLVIRGTGSMYDYSSIDEFSYSKYKDVVSTVKILDEVSSIGTYAFSSFENLEIIMIESDVLSINDYALYGCNNLSKMVIPNSVNYIGNIFNNSFPESLKFIETSEDSYAYNWFKQNKIT
ncbi:MAG: sigma-70 family RNA polymerase sigma factor [Oscillospiraceae bacterium]